MRIRQMLSALSTAFLLLALGACTSTEVVQGSHVQAAPAVNASSGVASQPRTTSPGWRWEFGSYTEIPVINPTRYAAKIYQVGTGGLYYEAGTISPLGAPMGISVRKIFRGRSDEIALVAVLVNEDGESIGTSTVRTFRVSDRSGTKIRSWDLRREFCRNRADRERYCR